MRYTPLLFVLTLTYEIYSQVLGIDFGTKYWKASLISPGKNLVIIQNTRSDRKTLNSIAFQDGIRYFQDDAKSKRLKIPDHSYFSLNILIGTLDHSSQITDKRFNGETYIFGSGQDQMNLQQVVGMIIKHIKKLASLQADTEIKDVVITVPGNWGFRAKMCLVNAAHIAGFSVLGLIKENSAAAIQLAISRNDTDPINMILFNYGSYNLQISVIQVFGQYNEQKNKTIEGIKILSYLTINDIGGYKIDEKVSQYLSRQFLKKTKIDPRQNEKSRLKLIIKSQLIKQILSANKQTFVYIQNLINGIDLNLQINRQVIQSCTCFQLFGKYLDQVLSTAQLNKNDITQIQMIGGCSRIPKVTAIIKQYFGQNSLTLIGSHINSDEAVAFGSAFRAANLSHTFRVKQLYYYDKMNIDIKLIISSADKGVILQQNIFNTNDQHGQKNIIVLDHNDQDIKITIYLGDDIIKEFSSTGLSNWKQKYSNDNVTGQPKLVMQFVLSEVYIVEIQQWFVNVTLNVTRIKEKIQYVEEDVNQILNNYQKDLQKKNQSEKQENQQKQEKQEKQHTQKIQKVQQKQQGQVKKQQQQKQIKQQAQSKEQKQEVQQKQKQSQNQQKTSQQQQKKQQKKHNKTRKHHKRPKKTTRTIRKQVQQNQIHHKKYIFEIKQIYSKYKKYSKKQIQNKNQLLKKYQASEKASREIAEIRNQLQQSLYRIKNNLEQQKFMQIFGKQHQLTKLNETVKKQLQWYDQNTWTATKSQLQSHFQTLLHAYFPIYNRTVEYQQRYKIFNQSLQHLSAIYTKTQPMIITHHWIKSKIQQFLTKLNETVKQWSDQLQKQYNQPKNQDPKFYNYQMIQKVQQLRNQHYVLKMIQRPKMDVDQILRNIKKKREEEQKNKSNSTKEEQTGQEKLAEEKEKEGNGSQEETNEQTENQKNNEEKMGQNEDL